MKDKRKKGMIMLAVMMLALLSFSGCAGESQAKELTAPAECSAVVLEAKDAVDQEIEEVKKAEAEAKAKAEAEAKAKAEAEAKAKAEAEAAAAAQAAQQQTYSNNYSNADGCIDNAEGLLW